MILYSLPISFNGFESKKVLCDDFFPSRLVGAQYSSWKNSHFIKECSTGTYLYENCRSQSYWHLGRLIPKGNQFSWVISLNNPFGDDSDNHCFNLKLYSDHGLILSSDFTVQGCSLHICPADLPEVPTHNGNLWYAITGLGIGKFHVFATSYLSDLTDGTVEHAF